MPNKFDPILGEYRQDDSKFRGVLSSDPSNPVDGWSYVNSTNHTLYLYYGEKWQAIHVLNPGVFYALLLETGGVDYLLLENDTDGTSYLALQS